MSIATSLQKVLDSKEAIKTSINNKGGQITSATPFSAYSAAIDNLPSGGGGDGILKSISESDFSGTTFSGVSRYITEATIPSGVTTLSYGVFSGAEKMKRVNSNTDGVFNLPSGITNIPSNTFSSCGKLEMINLPSGITSIGERAFERTGLKEVSLPNNVQTLGNGAFNSSKISAITLHEGITIGGACFSGCTLLKEISLPQSVTVIPNTIFKGSGLVHFECNSGVTSIGDEAFSYMTSLSSVTLNEGLTKIGNWSFSDSKITDLTIPSTVTTIGFRLLSSAKQFVNLTVLAVVPPSIGVLSGLDNANIYVPSESVEAYKAATNWSAYASRIQAIPS